jgi:2-keto-myo-inositol isomerase
MNRRESLQALAAASAAMMLPTFGCTPATKRATSSNDETRFRFCLNTSTINGPQLGLKESIDIAARAGYDGLELWIRDIQSHTREGNTLESLDRFIRDSGLVVENAIGFAPWLVDDEPVAEAGFVQMREEMDMMAAIGCKRIAAPAAGNFIDTNLNFFTAGERYKRLLALGRETGVMPQLEFWGASKVLFHMGQVLMIAAIASDEDTRILPDVYHMFRGGSGYESLHMLSGNLIEIFHLNDFPGDIPREQQTDADRVYPGDGAAPMSMIFDVLKAMGGTKVLSLELFNRSYWAQDPFEVASIGLQKMKAFV